MNSDRDWEPTVLRQRIQGVLVASAIGDALGWITEFERSSAEVQHKYSVTRITDFVEWSKRVGGRFHGYADTVHPGEYSDDTQLTLCTARCVSSKGHFDVVRFAELELPLWLDYARGAGRTVKKAAEAIRRKGTAWNSNFFRFRVRGQEVDYRDSGANGAAMRIAPIALVHPGWSVQAEKDIWANAIVTHGHPRAIWGALIYGYALSTLLAFSSSEETIEVLPFTERLASFIKSQVVPEDESIEAWRVLWDRERGSRKAFCEVFESVRDEAIQHLRLVCKALRDRSPTRSVLMRLGCFAPDTKGSGLGTVIAGVYLFAMTPIEVERPIVNAVNAVGSDTDSIAGFAGGLAGCLNGIQAVPMRWTQAIQDGSYLMRVGERLAAIAGRFPSVALDPGEYLDATETERPVPQFCEGERVYHRALGYGRIQTVERQVTPRGKEVTLIRAVFDQGQSAKFAVRDPGRNPLRALIQDRLI